MVDLSQKPFYRAFYLPFNRILLVITFNLIEHEEMRFRNYDNLRSFCQVARHDSFTAAAEAISLTKGAISHQVDRLEAELGFTLFRRARTGIELTPNGRKLLRVAELAFDSVEQEIGHLRRRDQNSLTIGMATYFASRWLSPRLMRFITLHPGIGLRIQPLIGVRDLRSSDLDMAIRWGKGDWQDRGMAIEPILQTPAMLTASAAAGRRIEADGIAAAIQDLKLLHDAEGSTAWQDWFNAAGLEMRGGANDLLIPDPNVRVQAVIDDQGVGLYDALVDDEVAAGKLYRYEPVRLDDYGYYLVYPEDAAHESPMQEFRDWILGEARGD